MPRRGTPVAFPRIVNLGLKVDVSTRRGTREGVPRLMDLLNRHRARATFFFALGPDHALRWSGLPGGDIGRRCRDVLREVRDAGFEVGIHPFDAVRWSHSVETASAEWTRSQMQHACESFLEIFDESANAHAAAGWQMNRHAYRLAQRLGFRYCSDTRGAFPFMPVRDAEIVACPQVPTTLPTLEEIIRGDRTAMDDVPQRLLQLSANPPPTGHVFTLRAEPEGTKFLTVFDELLAGWRAQGYTPVALEDCIINADLARLPRHNVIAAAIPGQVRPVAFQGDEFLA